jgi:Zn finger protein HypA/HybF involved in hydrogenase expression
MTRNVYRNPDKKYCGKCGEYKFEGIAVMKCPKCHNVLRRRVRYNCDKIISMVKL